MFCVMKRDGSVSVCRFRAIKELALVERRSRFLYLISFSATFVDAVMICSSLFFSFFSFFHGCSSLSLFVTKIVKVSDKHLLIDCCLCSDSFEAAGTLGQVRGRIKFNKVCAAALSFYPAELPASDGLPARRINNECLFVIIRNERWMCGLTRNVLDGRCHCSRRHRASVA